MESNLYFKNNFAVRVLNVLKFNQKRKISYSNPARPFYALSCRRKANSTLSYNDTVLETLSGSIAYVPAGVAYDHTSSDENMIVIHFYAFENDDKDIKVIYPPNFALFVNYFEKIYDIWRTKPKCYEFKCNEYLCRLIYMIQCEFQDFSSPSIVERAAEILIREIPNADFSVTDLPDILNISGAYLRKLFKEKYGTTPKDYLTQKRIDTSISLLSYNYFSIKDVAIQCGFQNEKYFSTVFKSKTGVSPSMF